MYQKDENDQVLDLRERTDKKIIKIATLKSSTHLNMQQMREVHNEALNATKDNGTTETTKELDRLRQTLEAKKVDSTEIGKEKEMIMKKLKTLHQSFNEERAKAEKGAKTIQVIQK